jgi:hypothetical protein
LVKWLSFRYGTVEDLTPGNELKASFLEWAGDDRSFFISLNQRDPRFFDVQEIAADGYARTPFYQNNEGYEPGPISRDKRYIALFKSNTTSDTDIYLYNIHLNIAVICEELIR